MQQIRYQSALGTKGVKKANNFEREQTFDDLRGLPTNVQCQHLSNTTVAHIALKYDKYEKIVENIREWCQQTEKHSGLIQWTRGGEDNMNGPLATKKTVWSDTLQNDKLRYVMGVPSLGI